MEGSLMDHYGYNHSQLHKNLVKEKYYALKAALWKTKQVRHEKIDYFYNKPDEICDGNFKDENYQMSILMKKIDKQRMKLPEAEPKQVYKEIEDKNSKTFR